MHLTIDLPDELAEALKARAAAQCLSLDRWASRVLSETVVAPVESAEPFETSYGMWAKYGPAPSAEEIDENRREMFHNFAQDTE
jgi:plasmid stability protein